MISVSIYNSVLLYANCSNIINEVKQLQTIIQINLSSFNPCLPFIFLGQGCSCLSDMSRPNFENDQDFMCTIARNLPYFLSKFLLYTLY